MEIWKDIKNYEGMYQVSNLGRIRALPCKVNTSKGYRIKKEHFMKATDNGKNYKIVGLSKNGIRKNYYVHRLVAETFIPNPNCYKVINHKDYDTTHNNVENLEWTTQLENIRYSIPNRPKITKKTKPYGKYIKFDKRYKSYTVVIPIYGKRVYKGSFKTLAKAIAQRDLCMNISHTAT